MNEPLHLKYRPKKWKDVIGQKEVVTSIAKALSGSSQPHSFLFTGPSGTGKTTLARIVASVLGCTTSNILEYDAASKSGVDDVRAIIDELKYRGFGESPRKMYIIDECHSLSKNAWQAFLKSIEEPPEHAFFVFCTTEPGKVPETIKTRCHTYNLKPVKTSDLEDLIGLVYDEEKIQMPEKAISMIARKADGSPRKALVYLSMCAGAEDTEEVARILEQPLEDDEIINLIRKLVFPNGALKFTDIQEMLKQFKEMGPESVRIPLINYLNACILNAKSERDAERLLDILAKFRDPYRDIDGMSNLILAVADVYFMGAR